MKLGVTIVAMMLMLVLVSGEISTKSSPAPSPDLAVHPADSPLMHRVPTEDIGSPPSPAQSPIEYSSPPEPEKEHSPSPSPSPSQSNSPSPSISPPLPNASQSPASPSPSPSREASDIINHSDMTGIEGKKPSSEGGGGKKVGIAFGVIAAVCVVGVAGFVYKKRQENIRRSRYGYAAREIL
ncbi:hypothetical protein CARUB_v10018101mg [Capsella rubella]|uniref:Uncharacterized protein n=1 Tax=Capsella rubella TaxID=81985 RepID=R0HHY4_9BRAS|nr:vegetative cell wall protein gp1 [Capsella rubella]EOA24815.1 hypothetical protein CARUB_v10018101mg [Capsella rubella]